VLLDAGFDPQIKNMPEGKAIHFQTLPRIQPHGGWTRGLTPDDMIFLSTGGQHHRSQFGMPMICVELGPPKL
jgi:hypothetical protein